MSNPTYTPTASLVVLTMGDRPQDLVAALESAIDQSGLVWSDILVVFNGVDVGYVPTGVTAIATPENIGIPGGRNKGLASTSGDVVVFLDDDARFINNDRLAGAVQQFADDDALGALSFRIEDQSGSTARRHVPRVGRGDVTEPGEVTSFLGGAVAIRRDAFEMAGGYADEFFYAMEESDLALGMIDSGYRIRYEPSVRLFHPRSVPSRHSGHIERTARNRVLLARRRLPGLVAVVYVVNWFVITLMRQRLRPAALRAQWRGTVDGIRARSVTRQPIRWSTVARLSRLGRPPIV